jgi:hypothetical protein
MSKFNSFKVNAPDVVSETIDGETVIINLYKGLYYNLNPVGSFIWTLIEIGVAKDEVLHSLKQNYPHLSHDDEVAVTQLLDRLLAEELIVEAESTVPATNFAVPAPASFEAPVLFKYADMQDLLALDPIHDVDETGWPNQPAEVLGAGNF